MRSIRKCQGIQSQHGQIGMKRGLGRAEVDMVFPPDLIQKGQRAFAVDKGFEIGKPFLRPIEFPSDR